MTLEDHEGKKNPDLVMLEAVHANSRTMIEAGHPGICIGGLGFRG